MSDEQIRLVEHKIKDLEVSFFTKDKNYNLISHLFRSFDDFVNSDIKNILNSQNPIEILNEKCDRTGPDGTLIYRYRIKLYLENPRIDPPKIHEAEGRVHDMYPMEARNRNMNYLSNLFVDVRIEAITAQDSKDGSFPKFHSETKVLKDVLFGSIPIMVGSSYCNLRRNPQEAFQNECDFDCGGYFIIGGNEKVLIPQDRFAENKPFAFIRRKDLPCEWDIDLRSVNQDTFGVPKMTKITLNASHRNSVEGQHLEVSMHHMNNKFPLMVLFRALGIESDREIANYIVTDGDVELLEELRGSFTEAMRVKNIKTQEEAQKMLADMLRMSNHPHEFQNNPAMRMKVLREEVLGRDFLPHVSLGSSPEDLKLKALFLGRMTARILKFRLGRINTPDDRDSYLNKRVETPGLLLSNLFRPIVTEAIRASKTAVCNEIESMKKLQGFRLIDVVKDTNIPKIFKHTNMESNFKYSMATGNWGIKGGRKTKLGVAQILGRSSWNMMISSLRHINTHIQKQTKLTSSRQLHATQMGFICPVETPDGEKVGIMKNLSIQATITSNSCALQIRYDLLNDPAFQTFEGDPMIFHHLHEKDSVRVSVNGAILGVHAKPKELYDTLKKRKRLGIYNRHIAVLWNITDTEIRVNTEAGRMIRPLFVLGQTGDSRNPVSFDFNAFKEAQSLDDLINQGMIEYLDVEECDNSLIAMSLRDLNQWNDNRYPLRYTHMELDPTLMMGVMAAAIPFSNHNQAPRNCYQSGMAKQAISGPATNQGARFDTMMYTLNYGQIPLVLTNCSRIIHADKIPNGMNAMVAIMTYSGFNQEDSLIMNKTSCERGMFMTDVYRTFRDVRERRPGNSEEEQYTSTFAEDRNPNNYGKLNKEGFVPENVYVQTNDVLIGKIMPQKLKGHTETINTSLTLKSNEAGYVDRAAINDRYFKNVNADGNKFAKIRLRQPREPVVGDKFSSRMGQKGTNGIMMRQEDMPFTRDGITPDIIINPHAIPSRMTIGQAIECIMGRACLMDGEFGDGTPFQSGKIVEELGTRLERLGMQRYGNEILYEGQSGRQIETSIFFGPTYYQRLKHMVTDKIHSRSSDRGPVVFLTRQPSEGRARDGGLRMGYMEVECMWSHGTMAFLKERFVDCSDKFAVWICNQCHYIATSYNPVEGITRCNLCENYVNFSEVRIPYALKLMIQEVQGMSIGARLYTSN